MKKTANYDLNQWEKPDRIMMEDFNADNAKLDAVIKSETHRIEHMPHGKLICGGVTEEAVDQIDLDVSQVDWDQYALCFLRVQTPVYRASYLRLNRRDFMVGVGGGTVSGMVANLVLNSHCCVVIPTLYDGQKPFFCVTLARNPSFSYHASGLAGSNPFTLWRSGNNNDTSPLPAGTLFELWGVR